MEQAQVPVAELARLRVLVQELVQAQLLVSEPELELALGLQLEREPPVGPVQAQELELARAAAPEPRQARELRVSRQLEL